MAVTAFRWQATDYCNSSALKHSQTDPIMSYQTVHTAPMVRYQPVQQECHISLDSQGLGSEGCEDSHAFSLCQIWVHLQEECQHLLVLL